MPLSERPVVTFLRGATGACSATRELTSTRCDAKRYHRLLRHRMHQQYLARNPSGYCGLGGTGLAYPVGVAKTPQTAAE